MPYLIRSAGGKRTAIPIGNKGQAGVIREDLIEALKGLTIQFELKISNVVDCSDSSDKIDSEKESNENIPSAGPGSNGASQHSVKVTAEVEQSLTNGIASAVIAQAMNEISLKSPPKEQPKDDENVSLKRETKPLEVPPRAQPNLDEQTVHPNMRPKLVNEFRSSVRPVTTLKSEPTLDKPKPNFTPLQVLKRQAENHVNKTQNGDGPIRSTFVDPIGDEPSPRTTKSLGTTSVSPPTMAVDKNLTRAGATYNDPRSTVPKTIESPVVPDRSMPTQLNNDNEKSVNLPSVNQPAVEPIKESVKPSIVWASLKVGSTISTCWLSEDLSVDPPINYITYSGDKILEVTNKLSELTTYIDLLPKLRSVSVHDVVFAKSAEDDSWYRAIVKEVKGLEVVVYYVDWGSSETLDLDRVRYLSDSRLSLTANPPCAVKVRFTNEPSEHLQDLFSSGFKVKVESYDEFDGIYSVTAEMK